MAPKRLLLNKKSHTIFLVCVSMFVLVCVRVRAWMFVRACLRRTLRLIQSHGAKLFVYHRRGGIWKTNGCESTRDTRVPHYHTHYRTHHTRRLAG